MDTHKETIIPESEKNAGEAATNMVVGALIQKIKRNLGEQGAAIKVPREEMVAYAIWIFRAAIDRVSGGETKEMDAKRAGEISLMIVGHRFEKGR